MFTTAWWSTFLRHPVDVAWIAIFNDLVTVTFDLLNFQACHVSHVNSSLSSISLSSSSLSSFYLLLWLTPPTILNGNDYYNVLELWRSESDRYGNCSLCSVHRTCPLIFYLCHCVAPAQVWWLCRDWFFTARRVCIARTMPSQDVYLPVCLSVKRRYCV